MKNKVIAFILMLSLLVLTACGGTAPAPNTLTPEELAEKYEAALRAAQSGNEYAPPIFTNVSDYHFLIVEGFEDDFTEEEWKSQFEDYKSMLFQLTGLDPADMQAYAMAINLMNISVDAVALIMPVSGHEQTVTDALKAYVAQVQQSFQQYLPDQYEIAKQARIETLADGTLVLVMCEGGSSVLETIKKELA